MASDFFISNAEQQPRMQRLSASATAHGPEFEWMVSGLLALRAQRMGIRFQIFSNVSVAKPCDDVVVRLPDHGLTFFIQLKHSRSGVKERLITEQAMLTEKGEFSVGKYFEFYVKLREMYGSPKNDDARLLTELPLEGVRFMLFTTKEVERKSCRGQRGERGTKDAKGVRGTIQTKRGDGGKQAKPTKGGRGAKGGEQTVCARGERGMREEKVVEKLREEILESKSKSEVGAKSVEESVGAKGVENNEEEKGMEEEKKEILKSKNKSKVGAKSVGKTEGAEGTDDTERNLETEKKKEVEEEEEEMCERKRESKADAKGTGKLVVAKGEEGTDGEQGIKEEKETNEQQKETGESKSECKVGEKAMGKPVGTRQEDTGRKHEMNEKKETEVAEKVQGSGSEMKMKRDEEVKGVKKEESEEFPFEDLFHTGEGGSKDVFALNSNYEKVWVLFAEDPEKERIYHEEFLRKLRIYDNQATSDQLGPMIEKEVMEMYGAETINILKTLKSFLRKWSEELTQDFCLTNDTLFDFLEHRLRQRALENIGKGLTFKTQSLEPLRMHCASLRLTGAPAQLRICVRGAPDPGRRAAKILQALQADAMQGNAEERKEAWVYLDGDVLRGIPENSLTAVLRRCHTTLTDLKDSTDEKICSRLLVAAGSGVREVALRAAIAGTADVEDEWYLSQLDDAAQQWMLRRRITFQGRVMCLERLEASWPNMRDQVDAAMLLAMDQKEGVEIGRALPVLEAGLLPRRMAHSSVVSANALTEVSLGGGQLALGGFPKMLLRAALADILAATLRESPAAHEMDLVETQWTILNYRGEPSPRVNKGTLEALAKKRGLSSIHHLEYITGDTMENLVMVWKDSYGNQDVLCPWVLPATPSCSQVLLCRHLSSFSLRHFPVVLLLGEAGVGKTTVVEKAAIDFKNADPSHWVVLVKLLDHRDILRKWQEQKGLSRGVQGALDLLCAAAGVRGPASRRCLEAALLQSGAVSVLVDGVDEVSPAFSLQVLQLLHLLRAEMRVQRLWVASRPEQEPWLRDTLRCPPLRLLPLSTAEQCGFLCARWQASDGREAFAERVVEWLGAQAGGLLATPLHLEMAAEAFALDGPRDGGGAIFEKQVTLLKLYSTFVEKKRRLFQERHLNLVFMENLPFTDDFQKRHENCAMLFLFSDGNYEDDLPFTSFRKYVEQNKRLLQEKEKFGIVWMDKTGKVIFIHQTFAEYFAAVWLWKNYCKLSDELILSNQEKQMDQYVELDQFVQCEKPSSPDHPSLLDSSNQPEQLDHLEKCDQINESDFMNNSEHFLQLKQVVKSNQPMQSNVTDEFEQSTQWNSGKQEIRWDQLNPLEQCDASEYLVPRRFVHTLCRESHRAVLLGFLQDMLSERWPLHAAAWRQDFQAVEQLLGGEWGPHRWEERDPLLGWTPLQCMESAGVNKGSALHRAAAAGSVATLEVLLGRRDLNGRDHMQRTPLHRAVYGRNLQHHHAATLRLLKEQGVSVNAVDADGATPLGRAVAFDCTDCVEALLQKGARPEGGSRPLVFVAALNNSVNVLRFLLEKGFPADVTDPKGFTPLQVAIQLGFTDTVRVLLERGAGVDVRSAEGWTPVHSAAVNGRLEELRLLLAHGSPAHACSEDRITPLHSAAEHGHTELVALLIEYGSPVDPVTEDGCTPVHSAAMGGHAQALKMLISLGARADTPCLNRWTPIHFAAAKGHFEAVKVLLDHGAPAECAGNDGGTPALAAAGSGHAQCLKLLLEAGASAGVANEDGFAPLHAAAEGGHVAVLELLLAHGVSIDVETSGGATALHLAVEHRRTEATQLLLARGATVHTTAEGGWTPVHSAAANGSAAALRLLLLHGGQVNTPGPQGLTPLHCAAKGGHTEAINILVAAGAAVTDRCPMGFTPLHYAALASKVEAAVVLLELGAPLDAAGTGGWTPVHAAAHGENPSVLRLLLDRGASAGATDTDGDAPLHVAAHAGRLEAVAALLGAGADAGVRNAQGKTPGDSAKEAGHELCAKLLEERALRGQGTDVPGANAVREAVAARTIPVLSGGSKWTSHSVYRAIEGLEGAWSQIFFDRAEAEEVD